MRTLYSTALCIVVAIAVIGPINGPAQAAGTPKPTISLNSQTPWVTANSGFNLGIGISTAIPRGDLTLRIRVYPRLESRYALDEQPLAGTAEQTISNIGVTGGALATSPGGVLDTLHFRTVTTTGHQSGLARARPLRLDCLKGTCDGDYPISVVLMDRTSHRQLASLVTTLIYLTGQFPRRRLDVALVLPLDLPTKLLIANATTSTPIALPTNAIKPLATVAGVLLAYPRDPVSLEIYPRLLNDLHQIAISGSPNSGIATQAITNLQLLVIKSVRTKQLQLVGTTYAPIDLTALVNGLGFRAADQIMTSQQTAARETLATVLHASTSSQILLVADALNGQAAKLVASTGSCQVVLPLNNVDLNEQGKTADAPFSITNTASSCGQPNLDAAATDSGFTAHFAAAAITPQLAAHQLLADLAQTYFEDPYSSQQRGVVIAPSSWTVNATFVSTLLLGLTANPILQPTTLTNFFAAVPIGANKEPRSATIIGGKSTSVVDQHQFATAVNDLGILESLIPTATATHQFLVEQLFDGESPGLTSEERSLFFSAPRYAISAIAQSMHLSGDHHVTFTAATGKIPITVHYTGSQFPVNVDLRIKSSSIDFPRQEARQRIVLRHRDTEEVLTVSTRTSGVYTFSLALIAPKSSTTLLKPSIFTITSTAASGVAIALSLGALFVLALWWSRSILRHRREKLAKIDARPDDELPAT